MDEHIWVRARDGHVVLTTDDYELFDWVEDHLTEAHNITYEYQCNSTVDGKKLWEMHFAAGFSEADIRAAVSELPLSEIQRVRRLNNPP